jgi:hypothetical protein
MVAAAQRLARPPNKPRLHRIVAIKPAKLIIERLRCKLRRILPCKSDEPAEEASREILIIRRRE